MEVEVDLRPGLPAFSVVGLPDTAVQEARERVRSGVINQAFDLPPLRIVANLAPADLRKAGPQYDLPIALALGHGWQLGLTPEIDAAVNQRARGRHLALGGAIGLGHALSDSVSLGMDLSLMRDRDPSGPSTRAIATASLAWQANGNTQFDFGGGAGLNHDSLDRQFYFGVARRF